MVFKKGNVPWMKGKHHTEESKQKISSSNMGKSGYWEGKHLTEEHRKKMSLSHMGHSGYWTGKHRTEDVKRKISLAKKGSPSPWKGKHPTEELRKKLSLANKGKLPWNTGKHRSEETRKKLSEANSGENHPFYGKHLSEEHREKIRVANKGQIPWSAGKHLSEETKDKIRNTLIDWSFYNEHGCLKSNYPYNDCFSDEFKDKIRALYDNKCVVTGMTNEEHFKKYGCNLHIHHWMYNKDETDPFYFIPVTNEINAMANFNRHEWAELFNGIAEDKYCELMR